MSDSVGSVSVDVVPDARGWAEKLRAQIRDQRVTVQVDADITTAAAQIDELARDRKATVEVNVDRSSLSRAQGGIADMVKNVSLLPALFIAAGAAAVPLAATVAGITAALAAPLAIAGGGVGLFAVLGGAAVKQTEKQLKSIDTLHKKLDGLTKGTQSYNDTLKQLNQAQASLTPAQVKFAGATDRLKASFQGLLAGRNGQALLGPITQGIDALAKILPAAEPLIRSVSGALSTLITDVSKAASGPGFDRFMRMFARQAGSDIVGFGHIIGNIATGLGGLFGVLDRQVGHSLVDELAHLTGEFSDWANSKAGRQDVKNFLDYFHQVGPQVASTIGSVAHAIGRLVQALAPLGPPVLHIIQGIADAIAGIPTGALSGILAATAGLSVAGYGAKKLGPISGLLSRIPGVGGAVLGGKGVVPVYVTNPGFGGPGGPKGILGDAEKAGRFGPLAVLPELAVLLGGLYADYKGAKFAYNSTGRSAGQYVGGRAAPTLGGPSSGNHLNYGALAYQANLGPPRAMASAFDAVRAHAAIASQAIDRIGPNAQSSLAGAIRTVGVFQHHLDALHDKRVAIIADTAQAIHSLEALQAYRLHNKYFTVYQRSQGIDRAVGPGGGIGSTPHTGGSQGGSGGGAGGGASRFTLRLDEQGHHTLTGFVESHSDRIFHANRDYEDARAGL